MIQAKEQERRRIEAENPPPEPEEQEEIIHEDNIYGKYEFLLLSNVVRFFFI